MKNLKINLLILILLIAGAATGQQLKNYQLTSPDGNLAVHSLKQLV